jgi:hypothetical protein
MAGLKFVGPDATTDPEIVYKDYVTGIKAADMSSADIDAAIDAGLNGYATRTYVDAQDGLLATQSYIDAQDNLRVPLSAKDVNSGVAGLGTDGKVAQARINIPITQRYVRGPWTPTAYNASPVSGTSEQTIYTCPVTDPGFAHKLVVFGQVDTHGYVGETPTITVRADNASTGPIIAYGTGAADSMESALLGDDFERSNTTEPQGLGTDWDALYTDDAGTPGAGAGWLGITSGATDWHVSGINGRRYRGRNIGANSRITATDLQRITAQVRTRGETNNATSQNMRFYGRVNDAFTAYVGIEQTRNTGRWFYANAGSEVWLTDTFSSFLVAGQNAVLVCGADTLNPRRFQLVINGSVISTYDDDVAVTAMGTNYRGWGFGVRAANLLNQTQAEPPSLNGIFVTDGIENYVPLHVVPNSLSSQAARTGASTLYIRQTRLGSGSVAASTFRPKLHVMAVPA